MRRRICPALAEALIRFPFWRHFQREALLRLEKPSPTQTADVAV
jgi:hypothetical protein